MSHTEQNAAIAGYVGYDLHFTNDLNAMRFAERSIFGDEVLWATYRQHIYKFELIGDTFPASAEQKANAFLRTVGLWKGPRA